LNVRRQSPRAFPAKDAFSFRTSKRNNHQTILSHGDNKSRPRIFWHRHDALRAPRVAIKRHPQKSGIFSVNCISGRTHERGQQFSNCHTGGTRCH
jgi:hypothetical protein